MPGCGENKAPPGYTANLLPLTPTWNYWPLGALLFEVAAKPERKPPSCELQCEPSQSAAD